MKIFHVGVEKELLVSLKAKGFFSLTNKVLDAEDLKDYLDSEKFNALLIDLDETPWGAFAVRYLRSKRVTLPIVGLTKGNGLAEWPDQRAYFLENGGNDLFRKPAEPRELAAAMRALTRLSEVCVLRDASEFQSGDARVRVNLAFQSVTVNGEPVTFTSYELRMVMMLVLYRGRILSRSDLDEGLHGIFGNSNESNTVEVFMVRVRKKLRECHPDADGVIQTVRGLGYRMADASDEDAAKVA